MHLRRLVYGRLCRLLKMPSPTATPMIVSKEEQHNNNKSNLSTIGI